MGDGVLAEFPSAVDALRAAIEFQQAVDQANAEQAEDRRIMFRVGLHLGDMIVDGDDLYGDGVNVAARLEGEAAPGGIVVSGALHEAAAGKLQAEFVDLGRLSLKNIERPVQAYRIERTQGQRPPQPMTAPGTAPLPLPDKPSIAVLPFQNMSGDPEQEYFVDGLVEEIITALSRFKSLFVIARNSSFTFKGQAVDIKEVGRKLGVRYVLEGSVRKASDKVRITAQLIEAVTGAHIWADRFERDLTDIFALQDEVTVAVVSVIEPKLLQTEIAIATRRRPENLTAYDFYLRANQQWYLATREGVAEAIRLARRALELDPRFGYAAALAGGGYMLNVILGYAADPEFERKESIRLSRVALSLDDADPETLAWGATTLAYMAGDCESAIEMADRALALNPNSLPVQNARGNVYRAAGLMEEAIRSFERAIRLNPLDPGLLLFSYIGMGNAYIELRRFDDAITAARKAQHLNPFHSGAYRCLAAAFAHLERSAEAREAAARVLEVDRGFTISAWLARGGYSNAKLLIEGLRLAGLPE